MYVIFIRCDKLTSNNKHRKQSQNNNTEYYCRLNACLLSTLNSVAVTALAGRRCWVSLLSRLILVRQSRPTEASVMTTVVTQRNERPVSVLNEQSDTPPSPFQKSHRICTICRSGLRPSGGSSCSICSILATPMSGCSGHGRSGSCYCCCRCASCCDECFVDTCC